MGEEINDNYPGGSYCTAPGSEEAFKKAQSINMYTTGKRQAIMSAWIEMKGA